jgi:ankyrin repeat protein
MHNHKFRTLMRIAIDKDDITAVIHLIEEGFDPNAVDAIDDRPYTQVAHKQGAYFIRDLLLKLGADPHQKNWDGWTLEEYKTYLDRPSDGTIRG